MRMTPRGRQVQKWRAGAASAVSTAWGATELTPAEFLQVLAEFQLTVLRYMPGPLESEEPAGDDRTDDRADTLDLAGRMTPHLASEGLYDALRNAWLRKSLTAVTDGSEVLAVVGPAFMAHLSTPTVAAHGGRVRC
jgi:hypothetical protein